MILKDYFNDDITFEQPTKDKLTKLYNSGKFEQFNKTLLAAEYSDWGGKQTPTEEVIDLYKSMISGYYSGNYDMKKFLSTIQKVETATCQNAPLYPEEEEYFASADKFKNFLHRQARLNSAIRKYGELITSWQKGCRHSVLFMNDEVASFKDAQELANALAEVHGLELTLKAKTPAPPSRERV